MNWRGLLFGKKSEPEKTPAPNTPEQFDQLTLDQLRKLGADLSRPREVRHYLYLPNEEASRDAMEILKDKGFVIDEPPSADPDDGSSNPWAVVATCQAVTNIETLAEARVLFKGIAARSGGEYDGWEADSKP